MKEKTYRDYKLTKISAWIMLSIFAFSLGSTFLLFNIKNVFNEKSLKKIGVKAITDLLEEDREKVLKNYDILQEFAKTSPEEELEIPTGIENFSLTMKGSDVAGLSKEEFFTKLPAVITDNTYDRYIGSIAKENEGGKTIIYSAIINELSANEKNTQGTIFIYITLISFLLCLVLGSYKKMLLRMGLMTISMSLPIYLMLYIFQPFIEASIRKTGFIFATFMVSDLLSRLALNYLYFTLLGVTLIVLGIIAKLDLKEVIPKKKGEFEKVIEIK